MKRLFLLLVLIAIGAGGYAFYSLNSPYAGFSQEVFLEIPKGTSTQRAGHLLQDAGVVPYWWQVVLGQALSRGTAIQAGEYEFSEPASVEQVLSRLRRGDIYTMELVVPEGSNLFDIAAAVGKLGVISSKAFLLAAANPALIHDLDPGARSLEGYLFPATYRLTRTTTAQQLCREMTQRFRKTWAQLEAKANVHDVVTLASLVEKEAAAPADRPLIASVFRNRLADHMSLDCDPTTIYAALLENRYRGTIYRSDLASKHEYNTYQHAGLPPGPIANPGKASLEAALHPADSDYLYFVLKPGGAGAHKFSATLAEHNEAVALYRKSQPR